jgi:tol-pal system protein YbgF
MFKNKIEWWLPGCLGIILNCLPGVVLASQSAAAPVFDLSQGGYAPEQAPRSSQDNNGAPPLPTVDASALPIPERVSRVEQQVNNLISMNLPQQIADLQQQVQQLSGRIQSLEHQLDQASQQQQRVEALPAVPPFSESPPNPAILKAAKAPPSDAGPRGTPPQTDAAAYEQAFSLLSNKQYDQSAVAFRDYLLHYPDGQFVANAHYWLGDIYFQQKNLTEAEKELNLVISQYSTSGKAADAQLKLAMLHAQQGNTDQARQELKAIMNRFPGSSAAQLASIQLQQLNASQGH